MSNAASIITHKQGGLLFRFTLLKFWEPESTPPPTVSEASRMIELCLAWSKARGDESRRAAIKAELVGLVHKWFPDWDGSTLGARYVGGGRKRKAAVPGAALPGFGGDGKAPEASAAPDQHDDDTAKEEPEEPAENEPETAPAERAKAAAAESRCDSLGAVLALIGAGLDNLWLHGPAGTGKTTICKLVAEKLGLPCTILSCSAGTSPAEILGFKYPEPRPSPVSRAIGAPGIVVFDEIPMLDPSVAAVANALLANGELETSTGHVTRKCIIIATANTIGTGSDRVYIGNNQLDGATLNRFAGGFVAVDYSADYESRFDSEVVAFCQAARGVVKAHNLRRIVSTRDIIAADKLKRAGLDWRAAILATWSDTERALLKGAA